MVEAFLSIALALWRCFMKDLAVYFVKFENFALHL